ncbi:Putative ribonuclease H protein At1g65750, partial [Linum perenne]
PREWIALNLDGSVIPETGREVVGGLFCDTDGRCLTTYSVNLRIYSITKAELRAVTGLHITWERGYRKVQMQLESRAAIQLLMGDGEATHQHSSEVASFRELLDRNWMFEVEHIYQECNLPADYLAGLGRHRLPFGVHSIVVIRSVFVVIHSA